MPCGVAGDVIGIKMEAKRVDDLKWMLQKNKNALLQFS